MGNLRGSQELTPLFLSATLLNTWLSSHIFWISGSLTEEFDLIPNAVLGRSTVCLYLLSSCLTPKVKAGYVTNLGNACLFSLINLTNHDVFKKTENICETANTLPSAAFLLAITGPRDLRFEEPTSSFEWVQ